MFTFEKKKIYIFKTKTNKQFVWNVRREWQVRSISERTQLEAMKMRCGELGRKKELKKRAKLRILDAVFCVNSMREEGRKDQFETWKRQKVSQLGHTFAFPRASGWSAACTRLLLVVMDTAAFACDARRGYIETVMFVLFFLFFHADVCGCLLLLEVLALFLPLLLFHIRTFACHQFAWILYCWGNMLCVLWCCHHQFFY